MALQTPLHREKCYCQITQALIYILQPTPNPNLDRLWQGQKLSGRRPAIFRGSFTSPFAFGPQHRFDKTLDFVTPAAFAATFQRAAALVAGVLLSSMLGREFRDASWVSDFGRALSVAKATP